MSRSSGQPQKGHLDARPTFPVLFVKRTIITPINFYKMLNLLLTVTRTQQSSGIISSSVTRPGLPLV